MKIKDICWLAGLLEGEGSFGFHRSGNGYGSIKIAIQMTDKDSVAKVSKLFGSKLLGPHGPYGVSTKQTWQTVCFGQRAASWMMTIYPLMGRRRKLKIRQMVRHWIGQQITPMKDRRSFCHPGRPYSVKGRCKSCARRHRYITMGD